MIKPDTHKNTGNHNDTCNDDNTRAHNGINSWDVEQLLQNSPYIWRGCEIDNHQLPYSSTGYPGLDSILPGHGWPQHALIEVITPSWGMGELQLLLPLMRSVIARQKWILWISPPYLLYAPALLRAGIDADHIIVVQLDTSCKDALWSIEKALQTQSCGLVLAWQNWLPNKVIRRLKLAAQTGKTLGVLFHHRNIKNSPSTMRLQLKSMEQRTEIKILKARGSYQKPSVLIDLYN